MPGQVVLGSIGRRTGQLRQTPVGGKVVDGAFWFASGVKLGRVWRTGTSHLLPGDDPHERLKELPAGNSMIVRRLGIALLTVRVDPD